MFGALCSEFRTSVPKFVQWFLFRYKRSDYGTLVLKSEQTSQSLRGQPMYSALFGNEVAKLCMLYIVNYGEGYIRAISRTFDIAPSLVRAHLEKLEADGILISQFVGTTKVFRFNPRLAIKAELTELLEKILTLMPEDETEKYFRERRRPRRTGKSL